MNKLIKKSLLVFAFFNTELIVTISEQDIINKIHPNSKPGTLQYYKTQMYNYIHAATGEINMGNMGSLGDMHNSLNDLYTGLKNKNKVKVKKKIYELRHHFSDLIAANVKYITNWDKWINQYNAVLLDLKNLNYITETERKSLHYG